MTPAPDPICRWCLNPVSTHTPKDATYSQPRGDKAPSPNQLGATLCPVVRDLSTAGAGPWERCYRPPTEAEARTWRESNVVQAIKPPTAHERRQANEAKQTTF